MFSSYFERVDINGGKCKQFKGGDVTLCAGSNQMLKIENKC